MKIARSNVHPMSNVKPLLDDHRPLERFPGKGGWTYVDLSDLDLPSDLPFGWVIVNGRIDNHALTRHKLMPKGDGNLFLSVRADIRKRIEKQAGDTVHVVLHLDEVPTELTPELREIFDAESPEIRSRWEALSPMEHRAQLMLIHSAQTQKQRVETIVKLLEKLST